MFSDSLCRCDRPLGVRPSFLYPGLGLRRREIRWYDQVYDPGGRVEGMVVRMLEIKTHRSPV